LSSWFGNLVYCLLHDEVLPSLLHDDPIEENTLGELWVTRKRDGIWNSKQKLYKMFNWDTLIYVITNMR